MLFLFEVAGVYASKEDTCIFRGTIANVGILILTVTINSNPHLTITLTGNHGSTIGTNQTTRLVTVGDRAFTAAGSRLWNSLPPDIRFAQTLPVFCNRLKTYLFCKCFPT